MESAQKAVGRPIATSKPDVGTFDAAGVLTVSAGHAAHDIFTAFLQPLLPLFIATLALSNIEAGLLTVFLSWSSLLQPFLGHLSDSFNLNQLVVVAPAMTAVVMSLTGVAPTYGVLVVLLLVAGLSSASLHTVGPAVVGKLSGSRLGRGMGLWMVGGELGRTLGPLIAVTAASLLGLARLPWLLVLGVVTSILLHQRLRGISDRVTEAGKGLSWRAVIEGMGSLALPVAGITVARSFAAVSPTTYLPILLTEQGSNLWFAGLSLSIFELAGVGGALVSGSISDGRGRRLVLLISV